MNTSTFSFFDEIVKISSLGSTFMAGAKQSLPWSIGFNVLENVTKPPHISTDTPQEKVKKLGKDVATGAVGFGGWQVGSELADKHLGKTKWYRNLKSQEEQSKLLKQFNKAKKKGIKLPRASRKLHQKLLAGKTGMGSKILRKLKLGAPGILAGLAGATIAEKVLDKIMGKRKEDQDYPLY